MDHHKSILRYFCRLCGSICATRWIRSETDPSGWKSKALEDVKYMLSRLHSVNVNDDDDSIHPPKICSACKKYFAKILEKCETEYRNINTFNPHTDNCLLCRQYDEAISKSSNIPTIPISTPSATPHVETATIRGSFRELSMQRREKTAVSAPRKQLVTSFNAECTPKAWKKNMVRKPRSRSTGRPHSGRPKAEPTEKLPLHQLRHSYVLTKRNMQKVVNVTDAEITMHKEDLVEPITFWIEKKQGNNIITLLNIKH